MIRGRYYEHRFRGRCLFIAPHPDDGAYLIMEQADNEDDEIGQFFGCEASDLKEISYP